MSHTETITDVAEFDVPASAVWALLMPEGVVPETRPPSQEQVRPIRDIIDPDSMRKREFRRRFRSDFGDINHD
jgi:hypothetical protein